MPNDQPHLRFVRVDVSTSLRRRSPPRRGRPADPEALGRRLGDEFAAAAEASAKQPGFDPRLLLKLQVEGLAPEELEQIDGVRLVAQEGKKLLVVFVNETARNTFQQRLQQIARSGTTTRKEIFFAISAVEAVTPDDRTGPGLRSEGAPSAEPFFLDVELWPLERRGERDAMATYFRQTCAAQQVAIVDSLVRDSIVLFRVRAAQSGLEWLLRQRDVRQVDLPPRTAFNRELLRLDASTFQPLPSPPLDAPCVAIVDSGLVSGHPLLASAVGDRTSCLREGGPDDENGHGTFVAGIALHGEVEAKTASGNLQPRFWLLSARIFDESGSVPEEVLPENLIVRAVEDFVQRHRCRIFNISVENQLDRFRSGSHVGPMAAVLDDLAREYGVLFVIPTGNFHGGSVPQDWLAEYPGYLLHDDARLIDPGPSLNSVTVGSLARYDDAPYLRTTTAEQPIARTDQPSPFTRSGPGACGAIKPELVAHGGNLTFDVILRRRRDSAALGEVSTRHDYIGGNLLGQRWGTSFAAPRITHLAGLLLADDRSRSANLLRALLIAHARWPATAAARMSAGGTDAAERSRRLDAMGYGAPEEFGLLRSGEPLLSIVAEDQLGENTYHFYEVPLPDSFLEPGRRPRRITVALAHTPVVRRTRIDYRCSSLSFRVVRQDSIDNVARIFSRARTVEDQDDVEGELATQFVPGKQLRSRGSVQCGTWEIRQTRAADWVGRSLFIVVERKVPAWAAGMVATEPYSLVVVLDDRERADVQLYTEVQATLQARERVRARVRGRA